MALSFYCRPASERRNIMRISSWLRYWTSSPGAPGPSQRRSAAHRFRPQLEALEDRCLPSTLTVTTNLDSGAGSLRAEIAAARSKDTIVFAPSLNGQTITLTSGELLINKNLTINGPGTGELTISANNTSRVFEVAKKVQVSLTGLTISDGSASLGGAIYIDQGGTLTIGNDTLSGNSASDGGAIDNLGTLTITNSTLSGNTAIEAAGAIDNYANLTISGCTLSDNTARNGDGGAIRNYVASLSISNSTLSGNSAGNDGGAIASFGASTLTLGGCTLSSNTALAGGALYNQGTMTVSGCTLSSNSAFDEGGGIYCDNRFSYPMTVSNSVFTSNTPDDIYGGWSDAGGNTFN
jgi:predicted outer membrane repeat protein